MSTTPFILIVIILAIAIVLCIMAKKKINKPQEKHNKNNTERK